MMPAVQLILLPLAADYEVKNIQMTVIDLDHSDYSQKLTNKITSSGYFKLSQYTGSYNAALKNIDKWLTLFEMSVEEKARYCKKMTDCFSEYKRDIKLQTDIKYRGFKNLLPDFFSG